jgi:hypothetical protein
MSMPTPEAAAAFIAKVGDPAPPPDPTPPAAPVPPSFDDAKAVVVAWLADALDTGKLKALLQEVLHNAVADALTQLGAPGDPLTAWANGWMTQIRTDYSKGGVLEAMLMEVATTAAHSVKVFMPNPEGIVESPPAGAPEPPDDPT